MVQQIKYRGTLELTVKFWHYHEDDTKKYYFLKGMFTIHYFYHAYEKYFIY
jgi:hypothetical protein